MNNPKTTIAAILGVIAIFAARFGFHLSPEDIATLTGAIVAIVGVLAADAKPHQTLAETGAAVENAEQVK